MQNTSDPAVILFTVIVYILVFVLFAIPSIITFWILVGKSGRPGWSQIIPVYNIYIFGLVAKKKNVAVAAAILDAVILVLNYTVKGGASSFVGLAYLVLLLILLHGFVKQYDARIGKWILFIVFPFIGVFFASSVKYIGGSATTDPTPPTQIQ